jgi:hypothetical protein
MDRMALLVRRLQLPSDLNHPRHHHLTQVVAATSAVMVLTLLTAAKAVTGAPLSLLT